MRFIATVSLSFHTSVQMCEEKQNDIRSNDIWRADNDRKAYFLKAPVVVESLDEKTVTCQVCG